MAFPTTPVLDTFNRGNENPLATASSGMAWGTTNISGNNNRLQVVSNTAQSDVASGTVGNQYLAGPFGPDCEVFVDVPTLPLATQVVQVLLRLINLGTTNISGYRLSIIPSTGVWTMNRLDTGTNTSLGTASQVVSAGDSVGLSMIGTTLTLWYKASGGSWTSLGTFTDSTYTAAGGIALSTNSILTAFDNFGGGAVLVANGPTVIARPRPQLGVLRRFPKQNYEPSEGMTSGSGATPYVLWERANGPDPPQVVLPLPSLAMQTVVVRLTTVRSVVERVRRAPSSVLSAPTVLLPSSTWQRMQTVSVALQAIARATAANRLKPHWHLFAPTVLANPPPPTLRQQTITALSVSVRTRTEFSRRAPHSSLRPPTAILPLPTQQMETVTEVWLAAEHTRSSLRRRAPRSFLSPPQTLATFAGPRVTLAVVRSRSTVVRRSVFYRLRAPLVVRVPSVEQQQATIRRVLARSARRFFPIRRTYSAPAVSTTAVFRGPVVVLARFSRMRRVGKATLIAPSFMPPGTFERFGAGAPTGDTSAGVPGGTFGADTPGSTWSTGRLR